VDRNDDPVRGSLTAKGVLIATLMVQRHDCHAGNKDAEANYFKLDFVGTTSR